MLLLLLFQLVALASPRSSDLDLGDRAWAAGDRKTSRAAWLRAADEPDPAVEAMARVRLLLVSGTIGMAIHGPQADRALARCPESDRWCLLAAADYQLFLRQIGLPSDVALAGDLAREALEALPGPATARLVWAGELPSEALSTLERDGLGDLLLAHDGRWPAGPGSWWLGIGFMGAPGNGVGGAIRFIHPDVGWNGSKLRSTATWTSRQTGQLQVDFTTAGSTWSSWALSAGRNQFDLYPSETGVLAATETFGMWNSSASAVGGIRRGSWLGWLGPIARLDGDAGQWWPGHGVVAGTRWSQSLAQTHTSATLSGELALASYSYQNLRLDLRSVSGSGPKAVAARLYTEWAPDPGTPLWRLPTAGGGQILRAAPAGRWRSPFLVGTAIEWRPQITTTLGAALFGELALVDGLHGDIGAGLRLSLPPRPHNIVRFDVAWGDTGLGLTAGWGQAF